MKLRLLTAVLLSSVVFAGPVLAQTQPASEKPVENKNTKQKKAKATPQPTAAAQAAAAVPARDRRAMTGMTAAPTDFGKVFAQGGTATPGGVTGKELGGGYMIEEETPKSRSTVTCDAIDKIQPTANPYQMINLLPGVNQASTDSTGLNGGNITLRGLNSDQLGLTIEGAPVNDSGNYALYPQEYVDAENTEQVSIAHGSPDLDSPHIGSTGGVINIYMRDPSKTAGGYITTSVGSHGLNRIFVRAESGQIGNVRGYVSYSHYDQNHWNGVGKNMRDHVDAKMVIDTEGGNHIRASFIYNDAVNNFYRQPTKAEFAGLPGTSYTKNGTAYLPNLTSPATTDTSWASYRINRFKNLIASLPSDFRLTDKLTYDVVPYMWYGFGSGGGVSSMYEDNGTSTSTKVYYGNVRLTNIDWNNNGTVTNGTRINYYNPSITETYRPGIVNKLTYEIDNHKIVGGYWFEFANHRQTAPYQKLDSYGNITEQFLSNSDGFVIPTGAYAGATLQRRDWKTETMTNVVFLGDTWSLMNDRLKIEYGAKEAIVSRTLNNYLPGATPVVKSDDNAFLPQIGASYKLTDTHQIFASVNTSFRVTPNYALADQFSTSSGAKTTLNTGDLKPERGVAIETGHRYQGEVFATAVSLFGMQFDNRQVTSTIVDPTNTSQTTSFNINAGSVKMYGVDAEIGTRPMWGGFRPYVSGELLKTKLEDNLQTTNTLKQLDYLPTKGKELPRAPNYSAGVGLDYDDSHILANLSYKYIGPQYSTFMNDEKIKGYGIVNAAIGYRFADAPVSGGLKLKSPEVMLNLFNIMDKRVLTGVNGVQTNAIATTGTKGGTIAASSAPTYYAGEGFAAMLTFKTGF